MRGSSLVHPEKDHVTKSLLTVHIIVAAAADSGHELFARLFPYFREMESLPHVSLSLLCEEERRMRVRLDVGMA